MPEFLVVRKKIGSDLTSAISLPPSTVISGVSFETSASLSARRSYPEPSISFAIETVATLLREDNVLNLTLTAPISAQLICPQIGKVRSGTHFGD
jgi:hypothetical protein